MRVPGLKFMRSAVRWSSLALQRHVLVLGYHRVAEARWDPHNMCVSPDNFVEQLDVLRSIANPISLERLVSSLGREALPLRGVVLTIDDGYLDSLTVAAPALRRFGVPATIFVSTGWMGREFWWDKLKRLIQSRDSLDRPVELSVGDQLLAWQPAGSDLEGKKVELIRAASDFMRRLAPDDQSEGVRAVFDWFETEDREDPEVRCMTTEEVSRLALDDLIEVGSHTVSHPMLSRMKIEEQRHELTASKSELEKILGRPVKSFCYPSGSYSSDTPRIAEEAEYNCACAAFSAPAVRGTNPYLLPRLWVPDLAGEPFRRWLRRRLW
jgi:peptidoglycan/xylan/chitin deacetylase (PgdA/CDA1 family)